MRNLLDVRRVRVVAVGCALAAFAGWSTGVFAQAGGAGGAGANAQAQGRGRDQGPPKPPDPREGLKPGLTDAGTAAKAMELVASMPKAEPFADPTGRGGLNFANSDLAFHGTTVVQGNFSGLTFFDVTDPTKPVMKTFVVCPGGQGDVSVYGHLLFMSVEATNGRIDCGVPPPGRAARGRPGTRGWPRSGAGSRPLPRRADLRHHRSLEAEADRQRADVPWLAHAHARHRSKGQGEHLHLRTGHVERPSRGRAGRLRERRSERRSEHRALQHRRHQSAARTSGAGGGRQPSAHLPGLRHGRD